LLGLVGLQGKLLNDVVILGTPLSNLGPKREDRSLSSVIRLAIRAYLNCESDG
jgi:hypothetical protein